MQYLKYKDIENSLLYYQDFSSADVINIDSIFSNINLTKAFITIQTKELTHLDLSIFHPDNVIETYKVPSNEIVYFSLISPNMQFIRFNKGIKIKIKAFRV